MPSAILDQLDTFGPDQCQPLNEAQALAYTRDLVRAHYENFSVISKLLPRDLRDDFGNVYAFCRWADDLGDETGDPVRSLELLRWWRTELDACYDHHPRHPVFIALTSTVAKHDIPRKPFDDLIDAFIQDQTVTRYETWDQLLDYCDRSANPVGRLVLYMTGYRDPERQRLSDATCTALQLANFWQDVRRDILERDRVYIPRQIANQHGMSVDAMVQAATRLAGAAQPPIPTPLLSESANEGAGIHAPHPSPLAPHPSPLLPSSLTLAYQSTIHEMVDRTWPLFATGRDLWPRVNRRVRLQIKLFTYGGESILRLIERQNYDTLTRRPRLTKAAKLGLMLKAVMGHFAPTPTRRP